MRKLVFYIVVSIVFGLFSCSGNVDNSSKVEKGNTDTIETVKIDSLKPISYFLEENVKDNFFDKLYSTIDGKDTVLISENNDLCLSIEEIADFDNNGYNDVLIEEVSGCGGNCCGNSFFVYTYSPQVGYSRLNLEGYDWDGIEINNIENHYEFVVETDNNGINTDPPYYKKETFVIIKDSLVIKDQFIAKKVEALKEIRSDMFENDDDIVSLVYDLDNDNELDSISCSLWGRWGVMTECKLEFRNGDVQNDLNFQTKRIGVLDSKTNGVNDLVLEFDDTIKWNGELYK